MTSTTTRLHPPEGAASDRTDDGARASDNDDACAVRHLRRPNGEQSAVPKPPAENAPTCLLVRQAAPERQRRRPTRPKRENEDDSDCRRDGHEAVIMFSSASGSTKIALAGVAPGDKIAPRRHRCFGHAVGAVVNGVPESVLLHILVPAPTEAPRLGPMCGGFIKRLCARLRLRIVELGGMICRGVFRISTRESTMGGKISAGK